MSECINNTWAEGLNPIYARMDEEHSKIFFIATISEEISKKDGKEEVNPDVEGQFLIKILNKRIEACKLPIKFNEAAKMAVLALVDRPGSVVALLIDCLNAHEGKTVTVEMLANLYPWGFYDEATLSRYINDYLKPRKIKWAEIY